MRKVRLSSPEFLEPRVAPANLEITGGALLYTAGAGAVNALTISVLAGNYVLNDGGETIELGAGAMAAGFTGNGTNTVTGPISAIASLELRLGDQDDQLTVFGLADPLTASGDAGIDAATIAGAIDVGGSLRFDMEALTVDAPVSGVTTAELAADTMAINAPIAASTSALLKPFSTLHVISLGAEVAGQMSLTDAELAFITTPVLRVGAANADRIVINGTLTVENAATVILETGGTIERTEPGAMIKAANLGLRAVNGIGTRAAPLLTSATHLEGVSQNGGFFVVNIGSALSIGGVDDDAALAGIQVTSGDIELINVENSILLDGTPSEDIRALAGNVTVTATGATANVESRNNSSDAIDSNLGSVSIVAGQDILIGSAAADAFGDVEANGNVSLTAGRDIIVDENSFVDVFGTGNLVATAGRHLAIVASDGTNGARMSAQAGSVFLGTGAGGTFSASSANAAGAVRSDTGSIRITTDAAIITSSIRAPVSSITFEPASAGRGLNLGTESAEQLSLTDAELDLMFGTLLRFGRSTTGDIVISAAISPALTNTISLVSGASITDAGAGTINVANLALRGASVNLDGPNTVSNIAGAVNGSSATAFRFLNGTGLTIAAGIDGLSGVSASGGSVSLTAPTIQVAGPLKGKGVNTLTGLITSTAGALFRLDINGLTAGTQHDQLFVAGAVALDGLLEIAVTFPASEGQEFLLLANDGADPITGSFAGLPEGAVVDGGTRFFQISYRGGDGNDVVLKARVPNFTVAPNGKSVTFTEPDGDVVTVKIARGRLDGTELKLFPAVDGSGRGTLMQLELGAEFDASTLSIKARRGAGGGNGFANVGFINAAGADLGRVTVEGDLGRIHAGAVKMLTVQSLGALGLSTQAGAGDLISRISGTLGKLIVKSSIHTATVLGSASIGSVHVLGSILGGRVSAGADLGAVTVRGDMVGSALQPVVISAFGKATPPPKGADLAIKSLKVGGQAEFLRVLSGYDIDLIAANADASIGAISVGADWRASTVLAGITAGADGAEGTLDDVKAAGAARDHAAILSRIARITIKGQAFGTLAAGDSFGIVAEHIARAQIGSVVLPLKKGARSPGDFFSIGATGDFAVGESVI